VQSWNSLEIVNHCLMVHGKTIYLANQGMFFIDSFRRPHVIEVEQFWERVEGLRWMFHMPVCTFLLTMFICWQTNECEVTDRMWHAALVTLVLAVWSGPLKWSNVVTNSCSHSLWISSAGHIQSAFEPRLRWISNECTFKFVNIENRKFVLPLYVLFVPLLT